MAAASTPPPAAGLHPQVRALAAILGVDGSSGTASVRFTQTGCIRSGATARWLRFRARQTIATRTCNFEWRARTGPAGLVSVRDALAEGSAELSVKALGVFPLARMPSTPALVRGELMRYLAEIALAPDAILLNPALRWTPVSADRLRLAAGEGERAAEVTLHLDPEGRIAAASASDRPRTIGRTTIPTPWQGRFSDYRRHAGRWLPFQAEAVWQPGEDEVVYWQGTMTSWEA